MTDKISLTLFAHITAKTGMEDSLREALQELISPTLKENGCLEFRLLQDKDNPAHFVLVEKWADENSWKVHMEMPYLKAFLSKRDGLVEDFKGQSLNEILVDHA